MTIPKRGSRRIVVDGQEYRWYVPRSGKDLTVQAVNHYGSILVVGMPLFISVIQNERLDNTFIPILPGEVAQYIRMAHEAGWRPDASGDRFYIDAGVPGLSNSIRYPDSFDLSLNLIGDVLIARISCRGLLLVLFASDITDSGTC